MFGKRRTKTKVKPPVKPSVKPAVKPSVKPAVKPPVKPAVEPPVKPAVEPPVKPAVEPSVETPKKLSLSPVPFSQSGYQPGIREIIGQKEAVKKLIQWLNTFNGEAPPRHPLAIMYGKPGVGKTTTALALGKSLGLEVIEVNASMSRKEYIRDRKTQTTQKTWIIENYLYECAASSSVPGFRVQGEKKKPRRKSLLLLDEIDGMKPEEVAIMVKFFTRYRKLSKRNPILCTCNHRSIKTLKPLQPFALPVLFHKVYVKDLVEYGKRHYKRYSQNTLYRLARQADGDIRQMMYLCEQHSAGSDNRGSIFDVTKALFEGKRDQVMHYRFTSELYMGTRLFHDNYVDLAPDIDSLSELADSLCNMDQHVQYGYRVPQERGSMNHWGTSILLQTMKCTQFRKPRGMLKLEPYRPPFKTLEAQVLEDGFLSTANSEFDRRQCVHLS